MVAATLNDMLNSALYAISQSLLIPVMVVLLIFFVYSLINLGILLSEYYYRRRTRLDVMALKNLVLSLVDHNDPEETIHALEESKLPKSHKEVLTGILESSKLGPESRESLARKMVENEEAKAAKKLEKTDIIAKIAPAVGLMGTLIPLGPGLSALGAGDIQLLSQHLIIAFGAAVIGMAAAAIGFTVSKIRRRWYEDEISTLDTMAESVLEIYK